MNNPYTPSPIPPPSATASSAAERHRRNALRPKGMMALVVGYGLFSFVSALVLMSEGGYWWMAHAVISILIGVVLRSLWWGDMGSRRVGVLYAVFCAALVLWDWPQGEVGEWTAIELAGVIETPFFLCAAAYLTHLRRHPFFQPAGKA